MRTIKVILGEKEKTYSGPSTWSEVPQAMALKLFNLVKVASTRKYALLTVPMIVYNIPYSVLKIFFEARIASRKYQAGNDDENYESLILMGEQILNSCKWVYSDNPPTTWLLKHVNVKGKCLDVCSDRLTNLTFGEFIWAEDFSNSDPAKLCALLYRKRSWWPRGGKRGAFDQADVEKYSKLFQDEKFNTVRNIVAWNYSGMVQHLKATYPNIFETASTGGSQPAAAGTSPMLQAALQFTDNDTIKFHALEADNLYLALKMIDNRIKQNKELEGARQKK